MVVFKESFNTIDRKNSKPRKWKAYVPLFKLSFSVKNFVSNEDIL